MVGLTPGRTVRGAFAALRRGGARSAFGGSATRAEDPR